MIPIDTLSDTNFNDGFRQWSGALNDDFGFGINQSPSASTIFDQPFQLNSPDLTASPRQLRHHRAPSSPVRIPLTIQESISSKLTEKPVGEVAKPPSSNDSPSFSVPNDPAFAKACSSSTVTFNPHKLGFIPIKFWPDQEFTFGELVSDFFQKKNNANSRFSHKLFNALKISMANPSYIDFLGVCWLNERVLRVDKKAFARLLGIKTIDGSLFHQQGNFPSHGFFELGAKDAMQYVTADDLNGVDYESIRLLVHQNSVFVRSCTEDSIEHCHWISSRRRN